MFFLSFQLDYALKIESKNALVCALWFSLLGIQIRNLNVLKNHSKTRLNPYSHISYLYM